MCTYLCGREGELENFFLGRVDESLAHQLAGFDIANFRGPKFVAANESQRWEESVKCDWIGAVRVGLSMVVEMEDNERARPKRRASRQS